MKVTTETIATREVKLTIEPDPAAIQKAMLDAARQISRARPLAGFRPGRAPYAMIERLYGREVVLDQALSNIAQDLYREAIEEADIAPYEQGQLDIASQDPLTLTADVALAPVVTLGDYKALHIDPEPEISLTDAQIDEQLEQVRRRHAEAEPVERAAQLGDQVVADITGTSDGEEVVSEQGSTLELNEAMSPAGFGEALVGMTTGERREFSLTYPEDYGDDNLAGKNVEFEVTTTTIRELKLPEIDDDLAKMAGDYDTLDELRTALAEQLKQRLETEARERESNAAIDAIVEQSSVEYPAAALEREIQAAMDNRRSRLQQMGFEFDAYLRMVGKTEAEMREELEPEAEQGLVRQLVLSEFAGAEELTVQQQELTNELSRISNSLVATYGEQASELLQRMNNQNTVMSVYGDIMMRKAVGHLTYLLTGRLPAEDETDAPDEEVVVSEESAAASETQQPPPEASTETEDGEEVGEAQ